MVAHHSSNVAAVRQLLDRVQRMDEGQDQLNAAQFQLIGLELVKQAYGGRWEVKEARIKEIARQFIEMRLGDDDVLLEGADGYMIVFGNLEGQMAKRTADEIGKRLNEHFTGEGSQPSPSIQVQNRVIAKTEILTSLNNSSKSGLPSPASEQDAVKPAENIQWRYLPAWNARLCIVSQYCLTPMENDGKRPIAGYNFESGAASRPSMAKLDELSMAISNEAVQSLVNAGHRAIIGTSVHVSTLLNIESRSAMVRRAKELDPELQRYRAVRIAGMAPGFPRLYLDDIMGVLPQLPNLVSAAAWNEPDLKSLVGASSAGISLSLPPIGTDEHAGPSRSELLSAVKRAAEISHAAHKPLSVSGCFDQEFAGQLVEQEADFLMSPNIWPAVLQPADMNVWPEQNLKPAAA